jgi:hypothetical protein
MPARPPTKIKNPIVKGPAEYLGEAIFDGVDGISWVVIPASFSDPVAVYTGDSEGLL